MRTVAMDLPASRVMTASLEADSRALEVAGLRLRGLYNDAHALVATHSQFVRSPIKDPGINPS